MIGFGRMARYTRCWQADLSERWRLIAAEEEEGWVAIAYDRIEKTEPYREFAANEDEAKAKARYFIVGIEPPTTFHHGSTLEFDWRPCTDIDSEEI
jgi:hypothetical protein